MHAILRTTARRTALGLGAVALALTAAGCGGSNDEKPSDAPSPAPTTASSAPAPAPSDGGGATAASDAGGAEDTTAASERFIEFMKIVDDSDWKGACAFALDQTGKPATGASQEECARGIEAEMGDAANQMRPGMFDGLTAEQVVAAPNPDGTMSISVMGREFPMAMRRIDDGTWYLDPSTAK